MREFEMKNVTPNVEKKFKLPKERFKERFEVSYVYEEITEDWRTTSKLLTNEIKNYFGTSVKKVVVKKIS